MLGKQALMVLAAVAAGGIGVGAAQAVTLADIAASGNMLVVGDKVYSDFQLLSASATPGTVTVDTLDNGNTLRFTSTAFSVSGVANHDAVVGYDLTLTSGTFTTVGVGWGLGGAPTGGAIATVSEGVYDAANNINYPSGSNGLNLIAGTGQFDTGDTAVLTLSTPTNHLKLRKDINVSCNTAEGSASISFVDNTFGGQGTPPPVPEPMSLALLPLALVGLGLRKRLAR